MSTITLLSDLGQQSTLIMLAKGKLTGLTPTPSIIDLTHNIEPGDLREAAYVLGEVIGGFPPHTVHVVAIGSESTVIGARIRDQIVFSPKHELLSMIPGFNGVVRALIPDAGNWHPLSGVLPFAVQKLWELNGDFDQWGESLDHYETRDMPLPVIGENELKGTVIHVDGAGNVFTNISSGDIDRLAQGRQCRVILSRHEWVDQISSKMNEGRSGMITCSISDGDHLVISVNSGNAKQLLGLKKGSIISIEKL